MTSFQTILEIESTEYSQLFLRHFQSCNAEQLNCPKNRLYTCSLIGRQLSVLKNRNACRQVKYLTQTRNCSALISVASMAFWKRIRLLYNLTDLIRGWSSFARNFFGGFLSKNFGKLYHLKFRSSELTHICHPCRWFRRSESIHENCLEIVSLVFQNIKKLGQYGDRTRDIRVISTTL